MYTTTNAIPTSALKHSCRYPSQRSAHSSTYKEMPTSAFVYIKKNLSQVWCSAICLAPLPFQFKLHMLSLNCTPQSTLSAPRIPRCAPVYTPVYPRFIFGHLFSAVRKNVMIPNTSPALRYLSAAVRSGVYRGVRRVLSAVHLGTSSVIRNVTRLAEPVLALRCAQVCAAVYPQSAPVYPQVIRNPTGVYRSLSSGIFHSQNGKT